MWWSAVGTLAVRFSHYQRRPLTAFSFFFLSRDTSITSPISQKYTIMLRSCFCCGLAPPRRRRRSVVASLQPPKELAVTPVLTTLATAKRRYRFHNSVHRVKRNKLHRKQNISLNHTLFVVPRHVPSCSPTTVE